jgi:tetratricopeptide (TPR) repeat protein
MARWFLLLLCVLPVAAANRWLGLRSGPFEVLSEAGDRFPRERLAELERFRLGIEQILGRTDLRPVWPIRILVLRSAQQASPTLHLSRDAYIAAIPANSQIPRPLLRECALLLMGSGPPGLPTAMERGLADVLSTVEFDGARLTFGAPLPPAQRNLDWARMHMLAILPGNIGKLRVAVHNLEQGVDPEPAFRNAFGKTPAELDREAEAYLRAGEFTTATLGGRPLLPTRDFTVLTPAQSDSQVALADLLLASPDEGQAALRAYRMVLSGSPDSAAALEGLALLSLREGQGGEARKLLARAVAATGAGARAWFEHARLESDPYKALTGFDKAGQINPRWGQPMFERGRLLSHQEQQLESLAAATMREPRNVTYWCALAEAREATGQFFDAARAWRSAELAAGYSDERQHIRELREQAELRLLQQDSEIAKQRADAGQRDLEMLKQKSVASIQAALEKAQRTNPPVPPSSGRVEKWWEASKPDAKVEGQLRQVDCLGERARLIIDIKGAEPLGLLIRDSNSVTIIGGSGALACGVQRPARAVVVEYFTKPDAEYGTAGDASVLQFP